MITTGKRIYTDFLIVGSGCAGLSAAIEAAEQGKKVTLVTKRKLNDCNSIWAQGGISCVYDFDKDSFESHIQDTLKAGAGLCNETAVKEIVERGPKSINKLIEWGVEFTRRSEIEDDHNQEGYDLGKEGGHSHRRVLHAGDITGIELINSLIYKSKTHPNIEIIEDTAIIDLISSKRLHFSDENCCIGAYALDSKSDAIFTIIAKKTILATGGAGKVYLYTTNPMIATGDGIAMGWRAYANIANMEFFQFHPTCLYHHKAVDFLISEAVRGEGAVLKIKRNGKLVEFMDKYHELKSLAPRDIVARAIDKELKKSGEKSVFLDITHQSEEFLRKRFPNIFSKCLECGINMATDLIPVVPAAHYCCGGIETDTNGVTSLTNLYAIGEVASCGLHGANRLASNSLLEATVMGISAINHAMKNWEIGCCCESTSIPDWNIGDAIDSDEQVVINHNWQEIRQFMWDYVGIFRTNKRLQRAKNRIRLLRHEIEQYYWNFNVSLELIELRNLATVAELIIDSAIEREESLGLHYNADKPIHNLENKIKDTIIKRK